jgi:NAD+ synthase (glutamine-hydrolysing)
MKPVRLAAAVLNQTPLDWRGNRERILAALEEARRAGASVLCLPELCITGYGCEDAFHSPSVHRMAWRILHEITPLTKGMVVTAGLPVMHRKGIFNFVCVMVDGRIAGFTGKRFLAGDGIHYEPRWFKPWPEGITATLEDDTGAQYPCGDLYYEIGGIRFGFEICEDAWVANRPGIALALRGVDVILNPSASHFAFGKHEIRKRFVLEGSRAFGATYVYANLLGNESGRAVFDGEAMIATQGRLCAASERFSFKDLQVITAQVDVEAARMAQSRTASYRPNLTAEEPGLVEVPFSWPHLAPVIQKYEEPEWERAENLKAEEFSRAVPLALLDYMRKSRSRGFVVSLSGGADSAACAVLVRLMVELALRELGSSGLKAKLSYMKDLADAETADDFSRRLLTTAYQASDNSGPVTRAAAHDVASSVSARHFEFNISRLVEGYTKMIEGGLGRQLTWQNDDIALQNIQARVRSPGIWMLTNITGALLLSTSNRSEAAVGYATMDGDTSGGLAPIAGIDKAWLREWLTWMEQQGPCALHSFPALKAVNVQAPTAELRPAGSKQTDEDDLMPYPLLDAIERAAILDKLAPVEIWQLMQQQFPQYDQHQLAAWVERFFLLWCRNQWKRERYAPSFHLDDENLDPKTWCRFPILSGGFAVELEELRKLAAESL